MIDPRGRQSHQYFNHRAAIAREFKIKFWFSQDPYTRLWLAIADIGPKLLNA